MGHLLTSFPRSFSAPGDPYWVLWQQTLRWGLSCGVFIGINGQEGRCRKQAWAGGEMELPCRPDSASASPAEHTGLSELPHTGHFSQSSGVDHTRACPRAGQLSAQGQTLGTVSWGLAADAGGHLSFPEGGLGSICVSITEGILCRG